MTPAKYKAERTKRGSQRTVAALLGVHPMTIAKREQGRLDAPITREAWLALTSLPILRKTRSKPNFNAHSQS